MTLTVRFLLTPGVEGVPEPVPASATLPSWYRELNATVDNVASVKQCVPFMEAMTSGFMLLSAQDIVVNDTVVYPTEGHNPAQIAGRGNPTKILNPWIISTDPGVSCWFKQPEQRDLPFRIFEGIVDTDTYPNPVNFPCIMEPSYRGIILKGTPIAQVIPFRREILKIEVDKTHPDWMNVNTTPSRYRKSWWHRSHKPDGAR